MYFFVHMIAKMNIEVKSVTVEISIDRHCIKMDVIIVLVLHLQEKKSSDFSAEGLLLVLESSENDHTISCIS